MAGRRPQFGFLTRRVTGSFFVLGVENVPLCLGIWLGVLLAPAIAAVGLWGPWERSSSCWRASRASSAWQAPADYRAGVGHGA
eukprot:9241947-Pyramimonas_sp.AAC.1